MSELGYRRQKKIILKERTHSGMSIGSQKSGIVQSSLKVVECHAPIVTDTITAARLFLRNDNLHSLKPHPRIASRMKMCTA